MNASLIQEFNAEMLGLFNRTGKAMGYWPRYFLRKVRRVGGSRMAKDLLDDSSKASGFGRLADENKLELSVEYLVLQARWWPLFTDRERTVARKRLSDAGYDGVPEENGDSAEIVYFNNCCNRPHTELFQADAFYDLNTTGVQAKQAVDLPVGQECIVASKPSHDTAKLTWYSFASERLMRERGNGSHAKKCRVFLGTQTYSETMLISKASREPLYAPFFDKKDRFKQWATIKAPRPTTASFEMEDEEFFEGTERRVIATIYERNPAARKRCIDYHGAVCCVCDFDFAAVYGEIAEGFIHVHHVKPMSEIGENYSVDPIKDLVPVCPNCHAVIHLGRKTRGIDVVKKLMAMMKKAKTAKS